MKNYQPRAMLSTRYGDEKVFMHPVTGEIIPDYSGLYFHADNPERLMLIARHDEPEFTEVMGVPFAFNSKTGAVLDEEDQVVSFVKKMLDNINDRVAMFKLIRAWDGNVFNMGEEGACLITEPVYPVGQHISLSLAGMEPVLMFPYVPAGDHIYASSASALGLSAYRVRSDGQELPQTPSALLTAMKRPQAVDAALDVLEQGGRKFQTARFQDGSRVLLTRTSDGVLEPFVKLPMNRHTADQTPFRFIAQALQENMPKDHPRAAILYEHLAFENGEDYLINVAQTIYEQAKFGGFDIRDHAKKIYASFDNGLATLSFDIDHSSLGGDPEMSKLVDRVIIVLMPSDTYSIYYASVDEKGTEHIVSDANFQTQTYVYFDELGPKLNESLNHESINLCQPE